MKYSLNGGKGAKIIFFYEDKERECRVVDYKMKNGSFKKEFGEIYFYMDMDKKQNYFLTGLGKSSELTLDKVKEIFFLIGKKARELKEYELEFNAEQVDGLCNKKTAQHVAEGLISAEYEFNKYKTDSIKHEEIKINYIPRQGKEQKVKEGLDKGILLMSSVNFARDLVNEPSNYLTPKKLAQITKDTLTPLGVEVNVYGREEIEKLGMHAFLEVARGSENEPQLIVMKYINDPSKNEITALVGKGITYDTGGYSIKPTDGMKTMFCDMGGSATVIGAMHALASKGSKTNVIAVVAACENSISGNAYKPGDIISSMKGKTIEIVNTDAEGRLTLADAIYFATKQDNVTRVIDVATLTGANVVALGEEYTGAITNNQEFYNEFLESALYANEKVWQLPNDKEFSKLNNSKVADIKNSGGRYAGEITAGQFVGSFLYSDSISWIHLDIAGTAYISSAKRYLPFGATGVHVRTIFYLLDENRTSCGCR